MQESAHSRVRKGSQDLIEELAAFLSKHHSQAVTLNAVASYHLPQSPLYSTRCKLFCVRPGFGPDPGSPRRRGAPCRQRQLVTAGAAKPSPGRGAAAGASRGFGRPGQGTTGRAAAEKLRPSRGQRTDACPPVRAALPPRHAGGGRLARHWGPAHLPHRPSGGHQRHRGPHWRRADASDGAGL